MNTKKPKTKKKTTTRKNNNLTDNRKWRFYFEDYWGNQIPSKTHKVISILVIEKIVPGKVHENDIISKWKLIHRYKDIRQLSSGSDFTLPTVLGGAIFSCNADYYVNLLFFLKLESQLPLYKKVLWGYEFSILCIFSSHLS